MRRRNKSQAALDFLISYGVAILIMSLAIYIVMDLGVFNTRLTPTSCTAAPSFSCSGTTMTPSGNLTIIFSQDTGGTMYINAIACSVQQNATALGPKYGNVGILPYANAPSYYPNTQLQSGYTLYSGTTARLFVNCYGPGSKPTKGSIGTEISGIVWINYTIPLLPGNHHTVQQLATFTTRYA